MLEKQYFATHFEVRVKHLKRRKKRVRPAQWENTVSWALLRPP